MTLIVDAAPLAAVADRADPLSTKVEKLLREEPGELVLPAPVSAEVDYMLGVRFGLVARRAFLADLAAGRYHVQAPLPEDYPELVDLDLHYADLELGLADCSVVLLAQRHQTRRLLTFDERHFRAVTPLQGGTFELLPADV